MAYFKFELRDAVSLTDSGERGTIRARAEYADNPASYLVRYLAADGCQRTSWWDEQDIRKIETP